MAPFSLLCRTTVPSATFLILPTILLAAPLYYSFAALQCVTINSSMAAKQKNKCIEGGIEKQSNSMSLTHITGPDSTYYYMYRVSHNTWDSL
jgi:hypothetical protein